MSSTIQTSRKIYAMKCSFALIGLLTFAYMLLNTLKPDAVDGSVIIAVCGSVATIVASLNWADGQEHKGHGK